jgi:hypothetical protein
VRQDGSHAGADVIPLDKRDLPDADASDIGDGVERARLVDANLEAQVAHPQTALRTAVGSCAAPRPASVKRMAAPAISLGIMGVAVWQVRRRWVGMVGGVQEEAVLSDGSNQ